MGLKPQTGSGFKPQARLHEYHHHNPHRPSGSIDGTSSTNTLLQQMGVNTLQSSTEFPPLTSVATGPEKRAPAVSGAWGRTSINRSIGTSGPVQTGPNVPAPHPYGSRVEPQVRQDETERGFERPPPKVCLCNTRTVRSQLTFFFLNPPVCRTFQPKGSPAACGSETSSRAREGAREGRSG